MDKRLIGKWENNNKTEIINIFDDESLKVKVSFTEYGNLNCVPNCIYLDKDNLCFEFNDEYYRVVYHLYFEDNKIKGYYTQFGNRFDIEYIKVSDVPEDGKFLYRPPHLYVPKSDKTRLEVLKDYSKYDSRCASLPQGEFILGGLVPPILEKYNYNSYINMYESNSDDLVFSIFNFVCDNFKHNGLIPLKNNVTIQGLIEFCENNDGMANCRGLAILLSSLLRLNKIKARHITCMPYEEPFQDCHVVVDCELPSGKRIMLDPSFRTYLLDENNEYISLKQLREKLINEENIYFNKDASYNGGKIDKVYYINYMTKNTFRFNRCNVFKEGYDKNDIQLIPLEYINLYNDKTLYTFNSDMFWEM